jgi:negative regulator of sigma E activity
MKQQIYQDGLVHLLVFVDKTQRLSTNQELMLKKKEVTVADIL